jgi:uncharacterized protein (TIGR02147 family)
MEQASLQKSLFEYSDFRSFLRDYYEAARLKDKKFSFRYFSRIAGFSSSGAILKIMNGKTNLSPAGADKISKALKLNKEETSFFKSLVGFGQSKTPTEKQYFAEQLLKAKTYRKIKPLSEMQFRFYSQWYYSVVREMVELPGFKEDPEWIAGRLYFAITPREAKHTLEDLLALGMVVRNPGGKLAMADAHISAGDEVYFSQAVNCHRQFLQRASESIDLVAREKRDISAMTICISPEGAAKLKEMIQKFRKDIVEFISGDAQTDQIYQLNMQLFPLTKPEEPR